MRYQVVFVDRRGKRFVCGHFTTRTEAHRHAGDLNMYCRDHRAYFTAAHVGETLRFKRSGLLT